jgi:hypothetical protein
MKKIIICTCLILTLVSTAGIRLAQDDSSEIAADFLSLSGPYLGQSPPGIIPGIFGEGIIDDNERVFGITFSPDGMECFYTKSFENNTIMTTRVQDGKWIKPAETEFSGEYFDFEPHITPDGKKMIYGTTRPFPGKNEKGPLRQWIAIKGHDGWSEPEPLGPPFDNRFCMYVSVSNNGNIYFTGDDGIYISEYIEGIYETPEKLDSTINNLKYAAHPFIAPDESYLIFDAQPAEENAELFMSFRDTAGHWGAPIIFDSTFNTSRNECCAFVSRDGKYLFFSRLKPGAGDIMWVDARVIETYRPKDSN